MVAEPDHPASVTVRRGPASRQPTLPAAPTSLIGRERDLAAARALLQSDGRLLTLTGAGGSGKTRLAIQLAGDARDDFADGVWFVPLATVTNPERVIDAIAHSLGVRDVTGQSLTHSAQAALQGQQLLLVLDNFEQVAEAAGVVAELLAACPALRVLVTSRAPLHLRQEQEYAVGPLALPSAVQLFVTRARAVRSDFAVTEGNAGVLAAICQRLDGLPLALELAAARSKLLAPEALLSRLESRLTLLTGGARDLPIRQQTLRLAIGWSYDLLAPQERVLFQRLAVFVGGATLAAIAAVCDADRAFGGEVLDSVSSLVDQSLLRQDDGLDGEPRVVMLETIREFALEALAASGEADVVRQWHAGYFLALAEAAEQGLKGPAQRTWLATLAAELDNLRAVLGWATERDATEVALRLAGALVWYWHPRGSLGEGRRWIDEALALPAEPAPTPARAKALYGAGLLAWRQGDAAAMQARFAECMALAQVLGDPRATAYAVSGLSMVAWWVDADLEAMDALTEEALALFEAVDDDFGRAWALGGVGLTAMLRGNRAVARVRLTESAELHRRMGDRWTSAIPIAYLARLAVREGDDTRARPLFEQALALVREGGDTGRTAEMLLALAALARRQGEHDRAAALCTESLRLFREMGATHFIVGCLAELAALLGAAGRPQRSARVFGSAEALRESVGSVPATDRTEYQAEIAALRAHLDEATLRAAWQEGRAAPLDDVIADALAAIAIGPEAAPGPAPLTPTAGLSPREVEVLRLLADGQSNKEIAAGLALSIHTVERHLVNSYAKIGARGRADAVAFALRHGLA